MRTLDEQNSQSFSALDRLRRDVKLAVRIASMALDYFVTGGKIRRRYRDKERRGQIYWVDRPDL